MCICCLCKVIQAGCRLVGRSNIKWQVETALEQTASCLLFSYCCASESERSGEVRRCRAAIWCMSTSQNDCLARQVKSVPQLSGAVYLRPCHVRVVLPFLDAARARVHKGRLRRKFSSILYTVFCPSGSPLLSACFRHGSKA